MGLKLWEDITQPITKLYPSPLSSMLLALPIAPSFCSCTSKKVWKLPYAPYVLNQKATNLLTMNSEICLLVVMVILLQLSIHSFRHD